MNFRISGIYVSSLRIEIPSDSENWARLQVLGLTEESLE